MPSFLPFLKDKLEERAASLRASIASSPVPSQTCPICKGKEQGLVQHLRLGVIVHSKCLQDRESRIATLETAIHNVPYEGPDIAQAEKALTTTKRIIIALCIGILFVQPQLILVAAILGFFLHSSLSEKYERQREPFYKQKREKEKTISIEIDALLQELEPIYEKTWNYPPDWSRRRSKVIERDGACCSICLRWKDGSVVPFHVHHLISISDTYGDHRLENLVLLCEICHSKMGGPGHARIKALRKSRLRGGNRRRRRRR